MESKTYTGYKKIRIYTGSGYEDFRVGENVRGEHIFGQFNKAEHKVTTIKVFEDGTISVEFEDAVPFWYHGKFSYRATN